MPCKLRSAPILVCAATLLLAAWILSVPPHIAHAQGGSACVACHTQVTPGIVQQWQKGKMSQTVDCSVCHGSEHKDATDAVKAQMPNPGTCRLCHPKQVDDYRAGKHSLAWTVMKAMPLLDQQPGPVIGTQGFKGCSGCHKIGEKSPEELKSAEFHYGTGSCDSCHTRHAFSKEEAKDPHACQTCHMGFDHPQWEMWSTSKHGTIWEIEGNTGRAPTCQSCHMAEGDHGVLTPWGFLAVRVPEDDPEWWNDRVEILKALGVLDQDGQSTERMEVVKAARVARLSKEEFQKLRDEYQTGCTKCHSPDFVAEQMAANDEIIREADRLMAEAIREVRSLYDERFLVKPAGWKYAPDLLQFFEAQSTVEQELYRMFAEYRMRTFQGAFHNNPDYLNWYGWAAMKESLQRIKDEAEGIRLLSGDAETQEAMQKDIADLKVTADKAAQAPIQAGELKAVQDSQQATQQQIADMRAQVQGASSSQEKLTKEIETLKSQVTAALRPNPIPWIAGVLAVLALVVGVVALVLKRT